MGGEASAIGRALANLKWAKKTKAERLAIGRKLTADRLAKQAQARSKRQKGKSVTS